MKVVIIKYNAGNIRSVDYALKRLGVNAIITSDEEDIRSADKVIFPGVGEAETTMRFLRANGMDKLIKELKQPVLGICLGMQLMCKHSEEGNVDCLGLIKGKIKHFESVMDKNLVNENGLKYKIPHMGWNNLDFLKPEDKIFAGIDKNASFYFVHSYLIQPENPEVILATADYGVKVPSAIKSKNIYAFQFHPEKSGEWGLKLLQNFISLDGVDLC